MREGASRLVRAFFMCPEGPRLHPTRGRTLVEKDLKFKIGKFGLYGERSKTRKKNDLKTPTLRVKNVPRWPRWPPGREE